MALRAAGADAAGIGGNQAVIWGIVLLITGAIALAVGLDGIGWTGVVDLVFWAVVLAALWVNRDAFETPARA